MPAALALADFALANFALAGSMLADSVVHQPQQGKAPMMQQSFLRACLAILIITAVATCATAQDQSAPEGEGWVQLFDGETLDGWKIRSGKATYKVEDGTIVGTTVAGSPNTFLISADEFADFDLRFEVLLEDNPLNSGVQIRSKLRNPDGEYGGRVYGPQVEIEASPGQAGYIYGEAAGGWQSPEPESKDEAVNKHRFFKNNEWNQYRVKADGRRIQTWINGNMVADLEYDEQRYEENEKGFIGLQVHGVGDSGPYSVRWKNIFIKPIE
jgi:hypothetical protein